MPCSREAQKYDGMVAESISKYSRFIIAETQKTEAEGIRKSRKAGHKAG